MPKIIYEDSESVTIDVSDLPVIKVGNWAIVDSSLSKVKEQIEWMEETENK